MSMSICLSYQFAHGVKPAGPYAPRCEGLQAEETEYHAQVTVLLDTWGKGEGRRGGMGVFEVGLRVIRGGGERWGRGRGMGNGVGGKGD